MKQTRGGLVIGKLFGIPISLHFSMLLVVLFISERAPSEQLNYGVTVVMIYCIVLLHELGHSLMALRLGKGVSGISLMILGGVASITGMQIAKPKEELLVVIAGPAVNVALFILGLVGCYAMGLGPNNVNYGDPYVLSEVFSSLSFENLLVVFTISNLTLFIFNMLPIFPLDGGRILRSLLNYGMSRYNATLIAARLGQAIAIFFIGYFAWEYLAVLVSDDPSEERLSFNWRTSLIGAFVIYTSQQELKFVKKVDELLKMGYDPSEIIMEEEIEEEEIEEKEEPKKKDGELGS